MTKYITSHLDLQEVKIDEQQKHTKNNIVEKYIDKPTGELFMHLDDPGFPWADKKRLAVMTAKLLKGGKHGSVGDKLRDCATWLLYLENLDGSKKTLKSANCCKSRFCPVCMARKARITAARLTKVLAKVQADHKGTQMIFLTLTLRNCKGDELRDTLTRITAAWSKLTRRRPFDRAIRGWFRAIEITYNEREDTYHPHIHAILVVEDAYFWPSSGLFLTPDKWWTMWRESLQIDYDPNIDICATYEKTDTNGEKVRKALAAAKEAAKYATKPADYLNPALPKVKAREVLETLIDGLHRKRTTAMGGWVADAADALALDVEEVEDLIHDEDGNAALTDETAEILAVYGFHFGVLDYVRVARMANPNYQGGAQGGSGTADSDSDRDGSQPSAAGVGLEGGAAPLPTQGTFVGVAVESVLGYTFSQKIQKNSGAP